MYDELYQLEEELKKVESCKLEYLPEYGYSSKEEIIQLIKEDISDVKGQIDQNLKLRISKLSSGYTDESLLIFVILIESEVRLYKAFSATFVARLSGHCCFTNRAIAT